MEPSLPQWETITSNQVFPYEILKNSTEFILKNCKKWYSNPLPLASESEVLAQNQQDTGDREDF